MFTIFSTLVLIILRRLWIAGCYPSTTFLLCKYKAYVYSSDLNLSTLHELIVIVSTYIA